MREGALYVFGALALILWFALFTYDPGDPGFSQASSNTEVSNGVGRVGALVADVLFSFFGRPAYLFTVMVFYIGWMLYREQKTQIDLTKMDFALRFGGFLATLVTSCALATLHFSPVGFNQTAGGIIGQVVGNQLADVMKLLGASTLLFFLWVASISLFLGVSWFSVMDRIGHVCLVGFERAQAKIGEPAAPNHASNPCCRRWRRACAPKGNGRCPCSTRRPPANCHRWRCWMTRRPRRRVTPKSRWRRCRAWSN